MYDVASYRPQLASLRSVHMDDDSETPRARTLRLLSLLQSGRCWPATELAARLDVPTRTLRRDLDHLRRQGYPVESTRGPGGGYRLRAGAAMPPLMLDDDEAIAAFLSLRMATAGVVGVDHLALAAHRAADKLCRILPPRLRRRTDQALASVELGTPVESHVADRTWTVLINAITTHHQVGFEHAGKHHTSHRVVEPVRLVRLRERWYLYAWDTARLDWRSFRIDRIDSPATTGTRFVPREPPNSNLARHLEDRFDGPPAITASLILHAPADVAATRLHRVDGTLTPLGAERCRYVAHVDSYEWLIVVLTTSDIEFTVQDQRFAEQLSAIAQRLLRGVNSRPHELPAPQ